MMPDVVDKCMSSGYSKKAIVLYTGGVMEILQMRYNLSIFSPYSTTFNYSFIFKIIYIYINYIQLYLTNSNNILTKSNCVNYISVELHIAWKNGMQEYTTLLLAKNAIL